jgi:type I restriction enzyme S subunit
MSERSQMIRLGDLCDSISGLWTGKKPPFEKATVIRNTNFTKDCKLDLTNVAVLDVETKQLQTRKLIPGDLIVEKSGGGPKQAVGRVVYFNEPIGTYSLSNFTSALRLKNSSTASPMYLQHFLYYQYASGVTESMQSHSTGIRNLNIHQFLDIKVPLPSVEMQREIVKKLDSAFIEIDSLVIQIDSLRDFIGELGQSFVNKLLQNSNEQVRIGDICTVTSSKRIFKSEYVENGIPFYRTKELKELANGRDIKTELFISNKRFIEIKERFGIPINGDILISAVGTIGEVLVVNNHGDFYFKDGNIVWLKSISKDFDSNFLTICLKSITKVLNDTAQGSAYSALTIEKLVDIRIPGISTLEQLKIVKEFNNLSESLEVIENNLKRKMEYVLELQQSILKSAFTEVEAVA